MPNPAEQPRFDQPVVDNQGRITRPWMDYFLRMASAQGQVDLSALTNALEQRLSAIESRQSGGFGITGNQPITVAGVPQPGHVVTIGLADLPDTGKGAALSKITRDSKGRVSGTQAATTDDLAEGGTRLYYTDSRADGRISAQKGQPNGLAILGPDSKVPLAQLPAIDGLPIYEGQEFLDAFHRKLISGVNASMLFSGDSTTLGTSITDPLYILSTAVLRIGQNKMHNLSATNAGHSGASTADWVANWVASDTAANPDLMILRWGFNDPYYGRNIAQFEASLRSGLSTIRASRTVAQTSIVLMTPSTANDTPNGRDAAWLSATRPVIRQVAKDFQCAFIDTYKAWPTAQGAAGVWMDNPFSDGRAIHPLERMNGWIASAISGLLFPDAFTPVKTSIKVEKSADQTFPTGPNTLSFDNKLYDARNEYNTSNFQFIPQRSGKYQIGASAYFAPSPENRSILMLLYVNGSEAVRLSEVSLYGSIAPAPGAGGMSGGVTVVQLSAGDVVTIVAYSNSVGSYTIKSYPFATYFTADRIA